MSYIPNCREDENYNQKYLTGDDKEFVRGYDWCTEQAVDNFSNVVRQQFGCLPRINAVRKDILIR